MKTIILISCVSKKIDLPLGQTCNAKDLYISSLFKKAYAYAKTLKPNEIYILSAKYGLLDLDTQVTPYNKTLNNMSAKQNKEWADGVLDSLINQKHLNLSDAKNGGDKFIILAGKSYYKNLIGENGIRNYECPYSKCKGIGYILKFLSDNI